MHSHYCIHEQRLVPTDAQPGADRSVVWIDLLRPTPEEEAAVEKLLGIGVPTQEEMAEIEVSSRLYRENDALYMTASLLSGGDSPAPVAAPVTFILTADRLVTVRYSEPSVFRSFARQAEKADSDLRNADSIFVALIEAIVDRTADILERVGAEADAISRGVFAAELEGERINRDYKAVLRRLGRVGDLNSKVRECLVSIGRLVHFVSAECGDAHPGLRERTEVMDADIRSLTDHSTYVSGTASFLLDATLGLINTEQNAIIKVISVISVVIMPPTLIASIYGMNFRFMPELDWRFGYPAAIAAMVLAAVIPYWFFRRRGWF